MPVSAILDLGGSPVAMVRPKLFGSSYSLDRLDDDEEEAAHPRMTEPHPSGDRPDIAVNQIIVIRNTGVDPLNAVMLLLRLGSSKALTIQYKGAYLSLQPRAPSTPTRVASGPRQRRSLAPPCTSSAETTRVSRTRSYVL